MFHDCSIRRFVLRGEVLCIEIERFSLSPDKDMPPARILISGLTHVYRNDVNVAAFEVESDDAEIVRLDVSQDGVELCLLWHFWTPEAPAVWCRYMFPGATLRIEALAGGPLTPVLRSPMQP